MKYLSLFLLLFVPLLSSCQKNQYGIEESSGIPEGLQVGMEAPNFQGIDILSERPVQLQTLLQDGPLVLLFYRGAWCPVCNRHLSGFQDSIDMIRAVGAQVIAIGPESKDNALKTADQSAWKGMVLSDAVGQIMDSYEVSFNVSKAYQRKIKTFLSADIAEYNDQEEAWLPVPATYIINKQGVIAWRHFDLNYKNRASVAEILKALNNQ